MDETMKKRIKELGEAINHSLSDSEPIAQAIGKIKAEGYELFLVLEATIGFGRPEEVETAAPARKKHTPEPAFRVTPQDLRFLKSMRIGLGK